MNNYVHSFFSHNSGGAYGTAAAGAVVGYALASGHNPMHGMHMGVNGEQSAQYVPVVLHRVWDLNMFILFIVHVN